MTKRVCEAVHFHNKHQHGSSTKVERILLMATPPSLDANEITDKGYINQRACLQNRAELVERLFAERPDAEVLVC